MTNETDKDQNELLIGGRPSGLYVLSGAQYRVLDVMIKEWLEDKEEDISSEFSGYLSEPKKIELLGLQNVFENILGRKPGA